MAMMTFVIRNWTCVILQRKRKRALTDDVPSTLILQGCMIAREDVTFHEYYCGSS